MIHLLSRVLRTSVQSRWAVLVATVLLAAFGAYQFTRLPIDAVPDITNVQVQINTSVKALAPFEVERRVTFPIESAMGGLPKVEQVRSLSRYGLSQVTVVFADGTDVYFARQLVAERLANAKGSLPEGVEPEMGPIATGLGEIYMWTVEAEKGARKPDGSPYGPTDLRVLQDWLIKPQLRTVPGVTEINSIGGYERIIEVAPDPARLVSRGISFSELARALEKNNSNAGGGYVESRGEQLLVRSVGAVKSTEDIADIVIGVEDGTPVHVHDVAQVGPGEELRTGAATANGEEVVVGTAIMLIDENSRTVAQRVHARLEEVKKALPAGVIVRTVYDRTYLVDATLHTVGRSLLEGAALVVFVLLLLLGNVRAALIAALAIPLSMLFAVSGMVQLGVSGNLMSLGAIDFGLVVDGAVIIVENCIRRFAEAQHERARLLTVPERLELAYAASEEVLKASIVGVAIITVVYLPILTLTGIEGKMFRPMAQTVILALGGATLLSVTFVPAMVAIVMAGKIEERENFVMRGAKAGYAVVLAVALAMRGHVVAVAVLLLVAAAALASTLGSEFAPRLGEGAIAIQPARIPSVSLPQSVAMQRETENALRAAFPDEIAEIFARTGTAEIATDPMGPNVSDTYVMLKPRGEWTRAKTQDELAEAMADVVATQPGQSYEFSQPIELRFNELISGVRSDVAVKVFGDDLDAMLGSAAEIAEVLGSVPGAADVKVEQVAGLPVLTLDVDRTALSRLGLTVEDVHDVVRAAIGGIEAGALFDGDRRFPVVVRLPAGLRHDPQVLARLPVALPHVEGASFQARFVPLGTVAKISIVDGPNQVSREDAKRRIVVQANVRGRDLGGFVADAQRRIDAVKLPAGSWTTWGGQFENLVAARRRLAIVVPVALGLIFGLLYAAFGSVKNALLIFSGVPLALTGGVAALAIRGLPLSISAGVGFIALSGVAVLNGLVMVSFIENLRARGQPVERAVFEGSIARLRPVLMTATVAALGFIPMAIASGTGAEVQRPLATVVIGGIVSSTLLTLVVLPVLYRLAHREPGLRPGSVAEDSLHPGLGSITIP